MVNKTDKSQVDWRKFKYMVFDIPTHKAPYHERYSQLGTQ